MHLPSSAISLFFAFVITSSIAFAPQKNNLAFVHQSNNAAVETLPETGVAAESSSISDAASKELSYAAILKVIDENHYRDATQACSYLPAETYPAITQPNGQSIPPQTYQPPGTPILSAETVSLLRSSARSYFDAKRGDGSRAFGLEVANLGDILSHLSQHQHEAESDDLIHSLGNALTQDIYPSVRSGWGNHDAFTTTKSNFEDAEEARNGESTAAGNYDTLKSIPPVLAVTSATVVAGGGYPGAKVAMTSLERDAGIFVVHIDIGNDGPVNDDDSLEQDVRGAIYLESLVNGDGSSEAADSIIGPLLPGQAVVHRSTERSAAMVVPSDLDVKKEGRMNSLDSPLRRRILKAAESTRQYSLRLVLTTRGEAVQNKQYNPAEAVSVDNSEFIIPEAPSAERAYRLRNFARFRNDKVRYLTLAGLLDVDDHENHFWLGFDHLSRANSGDYGGDLTQQLSDLNRAIFHFEKSTKLYPNDPRVSYQLATALGAKMRLEGSRDSSVQNYEVAAYLEKSAIFEGNAVKLGVNDMQDLAMCLSGLAESCCKLGEFDKSLEVIDRWAECGSIRSSLAIENTHHSKMTGIPQYEWIQATNGDKRRKVAVKTVGDVPVLTDDDISLLRSAADRLFEQSNGAQTSRYTMQYVGERP